jgi:DNA excision repair protein ERCC-2
MRMVHRQFSFDHAAVRTIVQQPDMVESQREAFLANFGRTVVDTLVGFAVMGGIFAEGVDLKGDRLTGAVIVGVGLPGICAERELIRSYFDRNGSNGFEFAYQYPGINRVLQAAGRVIRSEQDRGVVLLIDQRYEQQRYRSLFPSHWIIRSVQKGNNLVSALDEFWGASNHF